MRSTLKLTTVLMSALSLFGCTVATPFSGPGYESGKGVTLEGADPVVVSLTYAELRTDRKLRSTFWEYVEKVETSLQGRPGFIGYSKRTIVIGHKAWTMTVWADQTSLNDFVSSDVHQAAIRKAMSALASADFARVEVTREEIPLSWDRALLVLKTNSRG